jgi:hypothetical protein
MVASENVVTASMLEARICSTLPTESAPILPDQSAGIRGARAMPMMAVKMPATAKMLARTQRRRASSVINQRRFGTLDASGAVQVSPEMPRLWRLARGFRCFGLPLAAQRRRPLIT